MNSLDLPKPPAATRVVVAMSGGVDSCVVAALLKGEGYDVVGVTLQLYNDRGAAGRKGTCCAGRDIGDARAVAAKLGIPHYVLDYEARFHDAVIAPFATSYAAGETPIPCAACNDKVKFTDLLETARSLGADALATGHYCVTKATASGRGLYRGVDPTRDQSYFLFGTTAEQLAFVRFPLGTLAKTRVREIARELDLVTANKPDSQDICFVPTGRYSDIVARLLPEAAAPGDIVDEGGMVLGRHEGVVNYTIGQRRGLNISGTRDPLFVTRIDAAARQIVVGPRDALQTTRLALRDVNWLGAPLSELDRREGIHLYARTRSTQAPVPARFHWESSPFVTFPAVTGAVAPGQACVFYESDSDGARVLGGGTVTRAPTIARSAELAEAS